MPIPQNGVLSEPKLPASSSLPVPVEVVQTTRVGPMEQLSMVLGSVAGPFGTAALVLLLLFCMLLQRENLVGRVIRVVDASNISATTHGMEPARPSPPSWKPTRPSRSPMPAPCPTPSAPACRVMCLPVRADRDEIAGLMLTQLLQQAGFPASCLTAKATTGKSLEHVARDGAEFICISVAPPSTVIQARYLCGKLRAQFPKRTVG